MPVGAKRPRILRRLVGTTVFLMATLLVAGALLVLSSAATSNASPAARRAVADSGAEPLPTNPLFARMQRRQSEAHTEAKQRLAQQQLATSTPWPTAAAELGRRPLATDPPGLLADSQHHHDGDGKKHGKGHQKKKHPRRSWGDGDWRLNVNDPAVTSTVALVPVTVPLDPRDPRAVFHVIGDWGGPGHAEQRRVASAMHTVAAEARYGPPSSALPTGASSSSSSDAAQARGAASWAPQQRHRDGVDFVVSTGDNVYEDGAKNVDDPKFRSHFEDIYTQPALQVRWYMSLGNHDHGNHEVFRDVSAQVEYTKRSKRWFMPATYYAQRFDFTAPAPAATDDGSSAATRPSSASAATPFSLELFVLDTYDVSYYRTQMSKQQLAWLESALANSTATWRLVVGHRPLYSTGKFHGSSPYFQRLFEPLFKQHRVAAYLCGDDHDLQVLRHDAVLHVLSGAGARARGRDDLKKPLPGKTLWQDSVHGFASLVLTASQLEAVIFDERAREIYRVRHPNPNA